MCCNGTKSKLAEDHLTSFNLVSWDFIWNFVMNTVSLFIWVVRQMMIRNPNIDTEIIIWSAVNWLTVFLAGFFFWQPKENVWDKSESKTISETVKITWTVIWHNQIVVSQRNCLHILWFAFSLKSNNKHFGEMSRGREYFLEMWTLVVCKKHLASATFGADAGGLANYRWCR